MSTKFYENEPHLMDYLYVLIKRRWAIFTIFAVIVVTVAVSSFTMTPIYKATARVLIEKENPNVVNIKEVLDVKATDLDYYQTEYEVLKSNALALKVIDALKLRESAEFGYKRGKPSADDNDLIATYKGRLKIDPIRNSRLVDVSFQSQDSGMAASIANAHAAQYILSHIERRFNASQEAVGWLTQRIQETKMRLEESEARLQQYRKEKGVITVDLEERYNIDSQKLKDFNAALSAAKTDRLNKENLYSEVKNLNKTPDMTEAIPAVVLNPLINALKAEYIKLTGTQFELSQKYGPDHPRMIRLASEISSLKEKISQEVQKVVRSIETEYRVALAQERSILNALEQQKRSVLVYSEKASEYDMLRREVEVNRSLYESLLKRAKETNVTEGLNASNIMVVDPARIPSAPAKPNKTQNILLAIAAGLFMGVGFAFFLEYLDNTIKFPEDVKRYLNIPLLGVLGKIPKASANGGGGEIPIIQDPKSNISEAFRTIRTNILFSTSENHKKVILVTSAVAQEGKTVCAVNLAASFSQIGRKVLLIDADMRKPRIHDFFSIERSPGLSELLAGSAELPATIRSVDIDGVWVIPAGAIPPNPAELLISKNMEKVLQDVKEQYDIIIIDSPPAMSVTDPVEIATAADGVVLLIKTHATPRQPVKNIIEHIAEVRGNVIGCVLNHVDFERDKYYYYYSYSYYRYYSRYYGDGHDGRGPIAENLGTALVGNLKSKLQQLKSKL